MKPFARARRFARRCRRGGEELELIEGDVPLPNPTAPEPPSSRPRMSTGPVYLGAVTDITRPPLHALLMKLVTAKGIACAAYTGPDPTAGTVGRGVGEVAVEVVGAVRPRP